MKTHTIYGRAEAIAFAFALAQRGLRKVYIKKGEGFYYVRMGKTPAKGTPYAAVNAQITLL